LFAFVLFGGGDGGRKSKLLLDDAPPFAEELFIEVEFRGGRIGGGDGMRKRSLRGEASMWLSSSSSSLSIPVVVAAFRSGFKDA
jgi:hypothetical protein